MTSEMKTTLQGHEGGEGTDAGRTSTPGIGRTKKPINPSQAAEVELSDHKVVEGDPRMRTTNLPSPRSEVKSVVVHPHVETGGQQTDGRLERKEIRKIAVLERKKERDVLPGKIEIRSTIDR